LLDDNGMAMMIDEPKASSLLIAKLDELVDELHSRGVGLVDAVRV